MPSMIQAIVTKPYDGAGYDSCKPRVCVGLCIHCWDGHLPGSTEAAKIDYARKFFSTGGQRQYDALVDFVITKDGTIGMLNDPFGTRRPWANGWGDEGPGLEGDGVAFVDKFGAYGTNFNLASCEHEATCGEELTPAQFEQAPTSTPGYSIMPRLVGTASRSIKTTEWSRRSGTQNSPRRTARVRQSGIRRLPSTPVSWRFSSTTRHNRRSLLRDTSRNLTDTITVTSRHSCGE
jgi:hypothetical protein